MPIQLLSLVLLAALAGACREASPTPAGAPASPGPAAGHVAAALVLHEAPSCANCTGSITRALQALPGVSAVEVRVGDPALTVWHDPALATDALLAALEQAGEQAAPKP